MAIRYLGISLPGLFRTTTLTISLWANAASWNPRHVSQQQQHQQLHMETMGFSVQSTFTQRKDIDKGAKFMSSLPSPRGRPEEDVAAMIIMQVPDTLAGHGETAADGLETWNKMWTGIKQTTTDMGPKDAVFREDVGEFLGDGLNAARRLLHEMEETPASKLANESLTWESWAAEW
ncbi:hypothetical protein ColTof4_01462 [Colletotrichum tofieldiae]|nr:hypothetical protein ColTof3_08718 [Colletotrichum tofieldiae]GKT69039.1 hypothetical protein ColTof4_01462 [Colletotrichum tofieldiae]GKT96907.1 hypothetical protein Ct61P_14757 [Colletotrichum tofieldiae]